MKREVGKLVHFILERHVIGGRRFVLGIDGLSRAGKTTFVNRLRDELIRQGKDVHLFHLDDHIVDRRGRYQTGFEEWYEYYNLQWEIGTLRDQLFATVRDASEVCLPFYNAELDARSHHTVPLSQNAMVIIEGVFIQRQEWREFLDYVVYLDCPRETRFSRESEGVQENIQKFQKRYWRAEDYYLEKVRPLDSADIVISSC